MYINAPPIIQYHLYRVSSPNNEKLMITRYYLLFFFISLVIRRIFISTCTTNFRQYSLRIYLLVLVGPSTWSANWPQCGGKRQSPINIDESTVKNVTIEPPFRVTGYMKATKAIMNNNGHSGKRILLFHKFVDSRAHVPSLCDMNPEVTHVVRYRLHC